VHFTALLCFEYWFESCIIYYVLVYIELYACYTWWFVKIVRNNNDSHINSYVPNLRRFYNRHFELSCIDTNVITYQWVWRLQTKVCCQILLFIIAIKHRWLQIKIIPPNNYLYHNIICLYNHNNYYIIYIYS
jgi:hypothetical protein